MIPLELLTQSIIDGLALGLIYVIAALGLSLAFGVMHVINVAHGDFIVFSAFLAYWFLLVVGSQSIVFVLMASIPVIVVLATLGYMIQRFAVNRIIEGPPLSTLLFFFGFMIMMPNLSIILFGPYTRTLIMPELSFSYDVIGLKISASRMFSLLAAIIVIAFVLVLLYKTRIGMAIRATAQNREAALLCSINIKNVYSVTLALAFALASFSGLLVGLNFAWAPAHGATYTLLAFFTVVLGGMGYLPGTILAGLILGLAQTLISTFLGTTFVYAFVFLLLYLVLLLRPKGLLGRGI
jgi:branched-chain amino acid transport system permease protein